MIECSVKKVLARRVCKIFCERRTFLIKRFTALTFWLLFSQVKSDKRFLDTSKWHIECDSETSSEWQLNDKLWWVSYDKKNFTFIFFLDKKNETKKIKTAIFDVQLPFHALKRLNDSLSLTNLFYACFNELKLVYKSYVDSKILCYKWIWI